MAERQPGDPHWERRDNFRVSDEVLLDYNRIHPEEMELWHKEWVHGTLSAFALVPEMNELRQSTAMLRHQAEQESAVFAQLIEHLEHKLDRVIAVLMKQEFGNCCPQPLEVDIGAEGMGFATAEVFAVGQMLELRLIMPSTGLGLHTFAQVVRCGESRDRRGYRVGLQFQYLHERDREVMIQHVLQRQSMILRQRKQGMQEQ